MFCGGKKCKYESSDSWKPEEQAVSGIYSHWITDDIMAMARPNTTAIKKHKMVDQFQQLGLKSIINLQTPGIIKKLKIDNKLLLKLKFEVKSDPKR